MRRSAGTIRRIAGEIGEDIFEGSHQAYAAREEALLIKQIVDKRFVGGRTIYSKSTPCDFLGRYLGHPTAIEVKSWTQPTFRLCAPQPDIKQWRREVNELLFLLKWSVPKNALAALVVWNKPLEHAFILLPECFEQLIAGDGVALYTKQRNQPPEFHAPSVRESTVEEIAGGEPRLHYLPHLRRLALDAREEAALHLQIKEGTQG